MNDIDDKLNKYLDGEMTGSELSEFEGRLSSFPDLRSRLESFKMIDKHLRNIQPDSPSPIFTANLMKKLGRTSSSSRSQNYFMAVIVGIFILAALGIIGYITSLALQSAAESNSSLIDAGDYLNYISTKLVFLVSNLFNPKYFSYIGTLISIIMIVSGYFFFEHHRKIVKKTHI